MLGLLLGVVVIKFWNDNFWDSIGELDVLKWLNELCFEVEVMILVVLLLILFLGEVGLFDVFIEIGEIDVVGFWLVVDEFDVGLIE